MEDVVLVLHLLAATQLTKPPFVVPAPPLFLLPVVLLLLQARPSFYSAAAAAPLPHAMREGLLHF